MAYTDNRWFTGAETGSTLDTLSLTGTLGATTSVRTGALGNYAYSMSGDVEAVWQRVGAVTSPTCLHTQVFLSVNSTAGTIRFGFKGNATNVADGVVLDCSDGSIELWDTNAGPAVATSAASAFPTDGTWFRLDFAFEDSASGDAQAWVDKTSVVSTTTFGGSPSTGTASQFVVVTSGTNGTDYVDDVVTLHGDTGEDGTTLLDDEEVVAYWSTNTTTADVGGATLAAGTWTGANAPPFTGTGGFTIDNTTGTASSTDYTGVYSNDSGTTGSGGPNGDSNVSTGDCLTGIFCFYARRTNGGGPTAYGLCSGNDTSITSQVPGGNLTTSNTYYTTSREATDTYGVGTSAYAALGGYHTDDGGRDLIVEDMLFQTTVFVSVAGVNTLSADAGSYAVTGSAADFEVGMEADAGSYSVTGSAANFALGKTLGVESGSYSVTGEAADFLNGEVLSAEAGSYEVTGSAAEFPQGHVLPVDAGAYSYTGSAADLTFAQGAVTLDAESGSYAYTGSSADTLAHYVLETQVTGIETALFLSGTDGFKFWLNDANAIDGSTSTFAENDSEGFVLTSGEWTRVNPVSIGSYAIQHFKLYGAIPPANAQANTISKVRYRIYCEVTGSGTPQLEVVVFDESAAERDASSFSTYTDLQRDHFVQTTAGWTDWTEVTPPVGGWATYDPATWPDPTKGLIRLEMAGQDPTGTMTLAKLYTAEVEYTYTDAVYTTSFDGIIDAADLDFAAESGSYSVTGSDADFILERKVLAESGSYSLTGSAAEFTFDWVLDAESGSYSYTGFAAAFQGDDSITANPGSYTYTGADAALKGTFTFDAESGSYTYTGSDPNLILERKVLAESGAYTYSGVDVDLGLRYELDAESGAYAYTGTDADFTLIRKLLAEDRLYNIFFLQVKGVRHLLLPAEPGSYTTTGADVDFVEDQALAAESGSYSYTGADASLNAALLSTLSANAGAYTLTGSDANLTAALTATLAANSGSYNVTGADANLESSIAPLTANAGSYSYSGSAANLKSVGVQGRRVIMIG